MLGFGKKKRKNGPKTLEDAGFFPSEAGSGGSDGQKALIQPDGGPSRKTRREVESQQSIPAEMNEGVHARRMPKYVEAWGWAASAAKFRGFLVVILSLILCCTSVALLMTNAMLSKKNYIVVGMYPDGKPAVLEQSAGFNPAPDLFVRDFASKFLNYSHQTVDRHMNEAMEMATTGFRDSWKHRMGTDFLSSVKGNRIVQVTSISRIEIKNLEARQFTAEVTSVRYRSSLVSNETKEERIKYDIDVFRGEPTPENPWGFFVNAVRESSY